MHVPEAAAGQCVAAGHGDARGRVAVAGGRAVEYGRQVGATRERRRPAEQRVQRVELRPRQRLQRRLERAALERQQPGRARRLTALERADPLLRLLG